MKGRLTRSEWWLRQEVNTATLIRPPRYPVAYLKHVGFVLYHLSTMSPSLSPSKVCVEGAEGGDRSISIEESGASGTIRRNIGVPFDSIIGLHPGNHLIQESLLLLIGTRG